MTTANACACRVSAASLAIASACHPNLPPGPRDTPAPSEPTVTVSPAPPDEREPTTTSAPRGVSSTFRGPRVTQPLPGLDAGARTSDPLATYRTSWASTLRSSRVATASRPLHSLEPTAQLNSAPWFVTLDGGSRHVALDYDVRAEVKLGGQGASASSPKVEGSAITMLDDRWFVGTVELQWSGQRGSKTFEGASPASKSDTLYVQGDRATAVYQMPRSRGVPTPMMVSWCLKVLPGFFVVESKWEESVAGVGSGAISADGRVAIAMNDGRFLVLDADGAGADKSKHLVETKLPFSPYDISIAPPGYALFARSDRTISLHFVDPDGREHWSASVPFTPSEPPIDGGDGRIYVVGNGFAAYENGAALWSSLANVVQYATAYADGTVALVTGAELRIVARDGAVKQTFRTAQGEPISTPPAIADDGSIWIATEKALYVAR